MHSTSMAQRLSCTSLLKVMVRPLNVPLFPTPSVRLVDVALDCAGTFGFSAPASEFVGGEGIIAGLVNRKYPAPIMTTNPTRRTAHFICIKVLYQKRTKDSSQTALQYLLIQLNRQILQRGN